jgi:serine/threonine-protein kinase
MAEVYLGLSGELSGYRTLVVLKRILPHLASNGQFVRMFLDEARIEARLDHPNVVRIIEVGHDGDEYFLAMELVQGKPLSTVLRRAMREKAPLMPALAAFIIAQAANGLGYAHTMIDSDGRPMQIVHRDVSPQNILVSFEGAVKIIDFGIARATGRGTRTSPGGLKGKIQYMSPEQASAAEVDPRSDVFALGVVLWEVLVGQRLFYRENELAMMRAVVDEPIPSPSQLVPTPPELEAIVMRALDRDPDRRFHTAQEMGLALERFAFTNGSFSPQQLATYMKLLFASDFLQWKRTVSSAMEMEPTPPDHNSGANDFRAAGASSDSHSSSATLELGPAAPDETQPCEAADEAGETPIMPAAASFIPSPVPSAHDRLWVYGGIASLAMISIAGVLVLSQPRANRRLEAPPLVATRVEAPPPLAVPLPPRPDLPLLAEAVAATPAAPAPTVTSPPPAPVVPPAPALSADALAPAAARLPIDVPARPAHPITAAAPPVRLPAVVVASKLSPKRPKAAKDPRASRARAAKLSLASSARNRRVSIRDIGRVQKPKLTRAATSRTSRLMMDDAPLPPGRIDETLPAPAPREMPAPRETQTQSQTDHRRNPFD